MSTTEHQHYVPQFYLRRFADKKKRVLAYRIGTTKVLTTSVRNVATQAAFYDRDDEVESGRPSTESQLASIESAAKPAIERLVRKFPPSASDRELISLYVALQLGRTRVQLHEQEYFFDVITKVLIQDWTEEVASTILTAYGRSASQDNVAEIMRIARNPTSFRFRPRRGVLTDIGLNAAGETVPPHLLKRQWFLGRATQPNIATSDNPVVMYNDPKPRLEGRGVANSDEIWFPLDPKTVLMMAQPAIAPTQEMAIILRAPDVHFINSWTAASAYEWVFQAPGAARITDLIPANPNLKSTVGDPHEQLAAAADAQEVTPWVRELLDAILTDATSGGIKGLGASRQGTQQVSDYAASRSKKE